MGIIQDVGAAIERMASAAGPVLERFGKAWATFFGDGAVIRQTASVFIAFFEYLGNQITHLMGATDWEAGAKKFKDFMIDMLIVAEFGWKALPEFWEHGVTKLKLWVSELSDALANMVNHADHNMEEWARLFKESFDNVIHNARAFTDGLRNFLKNPAAGFNANLKGFEFSFKGNPNANTSSTETDRLRALAEKQKSNLQQGFSEFDKKRRKELFGPEALGPGKDIFGGVGNFLNFAGGAVASAVQNALGGKGGAGGGPPGGEKSEPLKFAEAAFQGSKEAIMAEARAAMGDPRMNVAKEGVAEQKKGNKIALDILKQIQQQQAHQGGDLLHH
jgi:hypothetical protein